MEINKFRTEMKYPMLNYLDFTLKASLTDKEKVVQKLFELGADFLGIDEQHDFYFHTEKGKLKYRKGSLGTLITHYERFLVDNSEKTHVYRYDVDPSEESVKQLYLTHDLLGETQKSRTLFQWENVTIHLDLLPDGNTFIEVEAKDFEQELTESELQQKCRGLFDYLEIPDRDLRQSGYL